MTRSSPTVVAMLFVLLAAVGSARAQGRDWTVDSTFSPQRFQPAPGPDNFINVETTRIGGNFHWSIGLLANYQYRPFVLYGCETGTGGDGQPACDLTDDPVASIIEHQVAGDLMVSFGFLNLFSVGLAIPAVFYQQGSQINIDSGTPAGELPALGGLGDLRLHLKFRLFPFMENDQEGFSFALATSLSAPIGQFFDDIPGDDSDQTGSFLGSGMVTVQPRLIFEYYMQPFHVAAQVGYRWQEDTVFYDRTLGHELTFGGGVGVWVIPDLQIFAEVFGSNAFTTRIDQTPLEADLAARYRIGDFVLTAGGGTGILKAIGSPVARAFLGFAYEPAEGTTPEPPNPDRDGDGILNDDDGCPDDPEDFDDYQDADGCSDPDNDGDGVLDIYDACPLVPEDLDGFEDGDGCPDLDHDGDGIPEPIDQCPTDPEDFDGFEDENGCPDLDNDADGIPDDGDVCPDEAEDFDGFEDEDGCPEPDNDQDGIPDAIDQCPDQPETLNGLEDEDGCPDRGRALVEVDADQIRIRQQVNFANDDDRIIGRQSFEILDVVATVLRLNPRVRVEVQGHTDNRGDYDHNIDLSQRRAQSVCNYLIEKGVSADRLVPRGYGPDQPIEDNRTNRGRSANRRVEFHILGAGGQDAGQDMPAPTDVEPPPPSDEMSFD